MWAGTVPESEDEALRMLESAAGYLADTDATQLPTAALAGRLQGMERADAVLTVARSRSLAARWSPATLTRARSSS